MKNKILFGVYLLSLAVFLLLATGATAMPHRAGNEVALKEQLRLQALKELPVGSTVQVESFYVPVNVPPGSRVISYRPHPALGVVSFEIHIPNSARNAYGTAVVRAWHAVAIARQPIRSGQHFAADNVNFEKRELTPLVQRGFFSDLVSLRGLESRGYIRQGTAIATVNTQTPFAIAQGEMTTVFHRQTGLTVSARVRALEAGRPGDWIRVQNTESRKILRARVTEQGELETR